MLLTFGVVSLLPAMALGGAVTLLPALCAAALLVGGVGAWLNLRGLAPESPAPLRAFVLQLVRVEVAVRHVAGRLHARDVVLYQGEHGRERTRPAAWLPSLQPGERRVATCPYRMIERGRTRSHRLTLASSFPLGLVEHRRTFELPADFVAMPRLGTVRNLDDRLPAWRGLREPMRAFRPGQEDFYGLREWRQGESRGSIHWRTTARQGKPFVRELRSEERPPVHVVLSTLADVRSAGRRHRSFEEAVSLAATVAESYLRRSVRVRFSVAGEDPSTLDCPRGRNGLLALLTRLAEVEATRPGESRLPALPPRARGEARILVVASGDEGDWVPPDDRTLVLDVDDRAIEDLFQRARVGDAGLPLVVA